MKKVGKYNYLYKIDTEITYDWLRVWVDANHPSFKNCIIDTSDNVHDGMNHVTESRLVHRTYHKAKLSTVFSGYGHQV
jgi:hypothetical protein